MESEDVTLEGYSSTCGKRKKCLILNYLVLVPDRLGWNAGTIAIYRVAMPESGSHPKLVLDCW